MPSLSRKVAMPDSAEMPAPVRTTMRLKRDMLVWAPGDVQMLVDGGPCWHMDRVEFGQGDAANELANDLANDTEREAPPMTRVAAIGECMIELSQAGNGLLQRSWGGDTLNTAVYLARLGVAVDYVTALGDDPLSDEMVAAWHAEGVGTDRVVRVSGRLPGLYLITTDAAGQRRFDYWRDSAPARLLFDLPQTEEIVAALAGYDLVYVSGISLALYGEAGRERLLTALDAHPRQGRTRRLRHQLPRPPVARPDAGARGLSRGAQARRYRARLHRGPRPAVRQRRPAELPTAASEVEVVLKLAEPGVRIFHRGAEMTVPAPPVANVVDTTAAGDSFAAAYLAARLAGADVRDGGPVRPWPRRRRRAAPRGHHSARGDA